MNISVLKEVHKLRTACMSYRIQPPVECFIGRPSSRQTMRAHSQRGDMGTNRTEPGAADKDDIIIVHLGKHERERHFML